MEKGQKFTSFTDNDAHLGIATMPDGTQFLALVGKDFFVSELGGYDINGTATMEGDVATIEAKLQKDGRDIRSIRWSMTMPARETINPLSVVLSVEFSGDEGIGLRSSFEDCIKRHAPGCAAACYFLGSLIPGCLPLCAVGAAACCLINTSC